VYFSPANDRIQPR